MASWLSIASESDFSIDNLPYGVFSTESMAKRIGVAIGEHVLDLKTLSQEVSDFSTLSLDATLQSPTLNAFAALPKHVHQAVRSLLRHLLSADTQLGATLRDDQDLRSKALIPMSEVTMHLPFDIGNYTDFFLSPFHAVNGQEILRGTVDIAPSWYSLPTAYHGRASSVVVSGTPIRRPAGQINSVSGPMFGPCQQLDFEVEFAAFIGHGNNHGSPIDIDVANDHIFGVVLMNDWSARDIQFWESTLGPFNGKNFGTTISPWVVTLDALEPYRTKPHESGPLLPYLKETQQSTVFDIPIQTTVKADGHEYIACECNTKDVSYSFAQMIAHHTAGGCPVRPGDLIATGTLSGSTQASLGCLLELTRHGAKPLQLKELGDGASTIERKYLMDGDVVEFRAQAKSINGKGSVGFGTCAGQILPCPTSKYF